MKKSSSKITENYIYKNSLIVSSWRMLVVLSGIGLDATTLAIFGLGQQMDVFFVALALPLLLASAFEQQVSKVVVPMISHFNDRLESWRYISNLLNLSAISLCIVSLLGMYTGWLLIPLLAPGLSASGIERAITLNYILFWIPFFSGLNSILRAALNALHCFSVPASTKTVGNVICILSIFVFYRSFGILSYCLGLVLARFTEFIIVFLYLKSKGLEYKVFISLKDKAIIETVRLMAYSFSSNLLSESRTLVENYLMSFLPNGSLSGYRYATRIIHAISGTLVGSISISMLPLAGSIMANNDIDEMKKQLKIGVRLLAIIAFPVSVCLIITAEPFVVLLFERGRFTSSDSSLIALLISIMTPYIFLSRFSTIVHMPFFADKNLVVPLINVIISLAANYISLFLLFGILDIYALPVSICIGVFVSSISSLWFLKKKIDHIGWYDLKIFFLQLFLSILVFAALLIVSRYITNILARDNIIYTNSLLLFLIIICSFVSFFVALKLRMEEAHKMRRFARTMFKFL